MSKKEKFGKKISGASAFIGFTSNGSLISKNPKKQAAKIALDIYSQLGGDEFVKKTGAKLSASINGENPFLKCEDIHGTTKNNIKTAIITYNKPEDYYIVEFIDSEGKVVNKKNEVFCFDLIETFNHFTGLTLDTLPDDFFKPKTHTFSEGMEAANGVLAIHEKKKLLEDVAIDECKKKSINIL